MKRAEVQRLPAVVTRQQWGCRTTLLQNYTYLTPMTVGKTIVMIPMQGVISVASSDAFGEGFSYSCPRYAASWPQYESFVPSLFVTFTDQRGVTHQYRTEDAETPPALPLQSEWVIGLNEAGEVVHIYDTSSQ